LFEAAGAEPHPVADSKFRQEFRVFPGDRESITPGLLVEPAEIDGLRKAEKIGVVE
jgi:hypothetical protein